MAGLALVRVVMMVTALVTLGALAEHRTDEPQFPRILDRSNSDRARVRILSERLDSSGGFTEVEELIDLELARAAYIETSKYVRTTWLVNARDNTVHQYRPFSCSQFEQTSLLPGADSPHVALDVPRIEADGSNSMFLFGVSGLVESLGSSTAPKGYSRAARADGRALHKWSLEAGDVEVQVTFADGAQSTELSLDSIEVRKDSKTTAIKVLSVERELPPRVYHNELQLPLIYGCRRDSELDGQMQQTLDRLAAAAGARQHMKMRARATSFATSNPVATEPVEVELALSEPRDAEHDRSPAKALMFAQPTAEGDVKTVIDRYFNVRYELNRSAGTCWISNAGPFDPARDASKVALKFSNGLKLEVGAQAIESMLHNVTAQSFMRLEQRGSLQYAYFADSYPRVFGPGQLGRVVRRFCVDASTDTARLDTVAIWVLEADHFNPRVREVFDFEIGESRPMSVDANSAEAFDVSRECYLNSEAAQYGRDYAWLELDYSLRPEQLGQLKDSAEELRGAFYRSIRANLGLNYLRVPKLEISVCDAGLTLRLLLLDSVPLHLIYDEIESFELLTDYVDSRTYVSSLSECSKFCAQHRCIAMTFSRVDKSCSISKAKVLFVRQYESEDIKGNSTSYVIRGGRQLELLPKDEQRLEWQIQSIQSTATGSSGILGLDEFTEQQASQRRGFQSLRTTFELNGQSLYLVPHRSLVELDPEPQGYAQAVEAAHREHSLED